MCYGSRIGPRKEIATEIRWKPFPFRNRRDNASELMFAIRQEGRTTIQVVVTQGRSNQLAASVD